MTALPSISGKELVAALRKSGFEVARIKGSHHFLRHGDGRTTVVPVHAGETLGPGLLSKILRDCELSREQLGGVLQSPVTHISRQGHRRARGLKAIWSASAGRYSCSRREPCR